MTAIDPEVIIAQGEGPADEWVELPAGGNLNVIINMLGFLIRKWGRVVEFTVDDIQSMAGAHYHLQYNPKTLNSRLVLHEADDVWSRATPGIEPGHA